VSGDGLATEAVLCAAYQEEAVFYSQALAATASLVHALQQGADPSGKLPHILGCLDQVAAVEARLETIKAAWQRSGDKPGPLLHGALTQIRELIEQLAAGIQEAEQAARQRKSQLEPELEAIARRSQMQRAYGNWR